MAAQAKDSFAQQWEAFLAEQGICCGKAPDDEDELVYDLTFQASLPGILEYRVSVHVKPHTMFFEATIPIMYSDEDAVCALVNQQNIEHPVGLFQHDCRDGELTWNHYLVLSEWRFLDKECLFKTLTLTHQMVAQMCMALIAHEADKKEEAE